MVLFLSEKVREFVSICESLDTKKRGAIEDRKMRELTAVKVLEHGLSIFLFLGWKAYLG